MFSVILASLSGGAVIGFLTTLLVGRKKSRTLPAGSAAYGIMLASIIYPDSNLARFLGFVCGLIGWLCYILITRPRSKYPY